MPSRRRIHGIHKPPSRQVEIIDDFVVSAAVSTQPESCRDDKRRYDSRYSTKGICCICFEERSILTPKQRCCHPPACVACWQQYLFVHVIPEVTRFPLVCFFPGCDSVILEHQVKFLARGENDLSLYYRNKQLSKAYQSTRRTVIHCPHCQHPRQFVSSSNPSEHILRCKDCGHTYYCVTNGKSLEAVVLERETLQAVEIMGYIEGVGYRDGWGLCPHCNRLLSGGDSYADGELIRCVCGSDLLWKHATDRVKRISRHVRQGMNTDMP